MTAETTHCEDAFWGLYGLRLCCWVEVWNFCQPYSILRRLVSSGMVTEQICETVKAECKYEVIREGRLL